MSYTFLTAKKKQTGEARLLRTEMRLHGKTILNYRETQAIFRNWQVESTFDYFLLTATEKNGRYTPRTFGFACQNPLRTTPDGKFQNPVIFVPADDASEIFGIDFDGVSAQAIIGEYCPELANKSDFFIPAASYSQVLTMPDIVLRVQCSRDHPGKEPSLAYALGAQKFEARTANRGCGGADYWILGFSQAKATPEQIWEFRHRCAEQAFPDAAPKDNVAVHLSAALLTLANLHNYDNCK